MLQLTLTSITGEVSIGIQRIDRSMWITVCAAISANLLGKRAEIEVVSPADGLLTEAPQQPVFWIIYDPAG
jgi:hypothetical protein